MPTPSNEKSGGGRNLKQFRFSPIEGIDARNLADALIEVSESGGGGGADGLSAYEIAVQEGFQGSIGEWLDSLKGEDGESAYEVAVSEGFEGTVEEWLESLKGEDGVSEGGGESDLRAGLFIPISVSDIGGSISDDVLTLPFPIPVGAKVFTNGEVTTENNKLWVSEGPVEGSTTLTPAEEGDQPLQEAHVGRVFSASSSLTGEAVIKVVGANAESTEFFLKDPQAGLALDDLTDVSVTGATTGQILGKLPGGGWGPVNPPSMEPYSLTKIWQVALVVRGALETPTLPYFNTLAPGTSVVIEDLDSQIYVADGTDTLVLFGDDQPAPGDWVQGFATLDAATSEQGIGNVFQVAGGYVLQGLFENHLNGKVDRAGGGGDLIHEISATSGAIEVDFNDGNVQILTPTGSVSLSFTAEMGYARQITLIIDGDEDITWDSSVDWGSGGEPVLTSGRDRIAIMTEDGIVFEAAVIGLGYGL